MINERTKSVTEEKRIVTGLVVSTNFLEQVSSRLDLSYFTNSYLQTIAMWSLSFFEEHGKAPFKHIQDIFESESHNQKEADNELIKDLLSTLSDQYDDESLNIDYLKGITNDYIRKREVEILANNILVLKEEGDLSEAEDLISDFKKVSIEVSMDHIINSGDMKQKEELYKKMEEEENKFFQLPGDLGRYLGNSKRGDVIAYFAPAKIGKSFILCNSYKEAVVSKKKTMFWSAEMVMTEINARIDKTFFPMVDIKDGEGNYQYPAFDCEHNQTGDCADRLSGVIVKDGEESFIDPAHVVCTKCKLDRNSRFACTTYTETIYREQQDRFALKNLFYNSKGELKRVTKLMDKYGRISAPPKYTLSYDIMMRDLDNLFVRDNFIPDILILDYIDILEINSNFDDYRLEDERWKLLAKIAGETNTLVISATQSNKAGFTAENLSTEHQGGFYGKVRHVNLMAGINQTAKQKELGIMQIGITEARSQKYIPGQTCKVLQDLTSGQAHLDSYCKYLRR